MAELVKLAEYARLNGVHPNTVHKWLKSGRLSGTKIGKGWRLDPDAVPVAVGQKAEVKKEVKKEEPAAVVEKEREIAGEETFIQRIARFNAGDLSEDEMVQFASSVEKLRKAGLVSILAGKVLTFDEMQARESALDERELTLSELEEGHALRLEDLERKEKSWDDDNAMLEAQKAELEQRERRLKMREEEIDILQRDMQDVDRVKRWAGQTVQALMNSETWFAAFQAEKVEIPDWPIDLDENVIASWAKLPILEEKEATPKKQPKKKKKQVKAKKQTVDENMFDVS